MSDLDEKKIEEVLTRLLEGPVGDALCSKIVAQVGRDMDKAMEPFVTKAQMEREAKEAEAASKKFHELMAEGNASMASFLEEMSSHPIRIHNLEVLRAVDHYQAFNPKEHPHLEMLLMGQIRARVLDDLKKWTQRKDMVSDAKEMMEQILTYLEPDDSDRGPAN